MKAWFPTLAAGWLALLVASVSGFAQSPAPSQSPAVAEDASPAPEPNPIDTGTAQAAKEAAGCKTADALWSHIQDLEKGPGTNATQEDVQLLIVRLAYCANQFETRYPKDARRWDAKLIALRYGAMLATADSQPDPAQIESELQAVAHAPDASHEARVAARISLIGLHTGEGDQDGLSPDLEKEMVGFLHDFPDDPNDAELQKARLGSLQKTDPAKASAFLDTLLKDKNPAVAEMAQAEARRRDLTKQPLDLKYTAVDGSAVDVSKLRGKVVIVDFWATWCAPCMEAVPDVVALYKELHAKGLEIVGISLDEDKGSMEGVTKSSGMVWPQYFDGKGWDNAISSRYGVTDIPQMWLVDRKGMVVDTDGADDLKEKVEKLVAQ